MKICTNCKILLSLLCFYKNKNTKDGMSYFCKRCHKEKTKKYKKSKRRIKIDNEKRYAKHKNKILEKNREYYYKNKNKIHSKQKEWRKVNKESIYLRNRARKLKIKEFDKVSQDFINKIKTEILNCVYCNIKLDDINRHIDHIVPLSKGGKHSPNNITLCCKTCNLSKGSKQLDTWLLGR